MKGILIASALLGSSVAFAADLDAKINNFTYTGSRTWTAEICGLVTGTGYENSIVTVTVDEKEKKPAKYTTLADETGNFCLVVTSYRGTASAVAKPK